MDKYSTGQQNLLTMLPKHLMGVLTVFGAIGGLISAVLLLQSNFLLFLSCAIGITLLCVLIICFHIITAKRMYKSGRRPTYIYPPRTRKIAGLVSITLLLVICVVFVIPSFRRDVWASISGQPHLASSMYARPGETLISIAQFHHTETYNEPEFKIQKRIEDELRQLDEHGVRVQILPITYRAGEREKAEKLGRELGASIIIWGEDTGVQVAVNYLNLGDSHMSPPNVEIIEYDAAFRADSLAYNYFITRDLPGQLTFLSLFTIAQIYDANAHYGQAISLFERAVSSTNSPALNFNLAAAHFRLGQLYATEQIDLERAIYHYNKFLELDPDYAGMAYYFIGNLYERKKDNDQALYSYSKAIELSPALPFAYNARGYLHVAINRVEEAIADFEHAIKLTPALSTAYNGLCRFLALEQQFDKALPHCNRAIEMEPLPHYYESRAIAYMLGGQANKAAEDYQMIVDILETQDQSDESIQSRLEYYRRMVDAMSGG